MRSTRIRNYMRQNVLGLVAIFIALSGTAYATHPGGADTISSGDIINGEVRTGDIGDLEVRASDIAADSLGSGKIAERSVKNSDLGLGASSSNTIADGGIQGVDVKNDTLTGAQIDEDTLVGGPTNPTGPAGGDLTGTYPNPTIDFEAVNSAKVEDESLSDDDIDDHSRSVNLPIGAFLNVTDTEAIDFDSGSDNDPDYAIVNSHATLAYDDGGGALTDSDEVGASFVVPDDYASGGSFRITISRSTTTAANTEQLSCEVASGGVNSPAASTNTQNVPAQRVSVTPSTTYFGGSAASVNCRQNNPLADDGIRIHAVDFIYVADQ